MMVVGLAESLLLEGALQFSCLAVCHYGTSTKETRFFIALFNSLASSVRF
jgi:hypothetical protein